MIVFFQAPNSSKWKDIIKLRAGSFVTQLSYLGNGLLASYSENHQIQIWNIYDGECLAVFDCDVEFLCGLPDAKLLTKQKYKSNLLQIRNLRTLECNQIKTDGEIQCAELMPNSRIAFGEDFDTKKRIAFYIIKDLSIINVGVI